MFFFQNKKFYTITKLKKKILIEKKNLTNLFGSQEKEKIKNLKTLKY